MPVSVSRPQAVQRAVVDEPLVRSVMTAASPRAAAWAWLGLALLLAVVALFAFAPIFAVDFFWHLKLGQLVAQRGAIPDRDLFSAVHPDRPYVQFQWLWELMAYGAFALGKLRGVRLMQVVWMTGSFALLWVVAWRRLRHGPLVLLFCCVALVLFEDRFQVRPSATVLGFVACSLWLWLTEPSPRVLRDGLLVFVLGALWSNMHGGESVLLPLGLGALALGETLEHWRFDNLTRERARARWLHLAAALLGIICSPTLLPGLRDWTAAIGPQLATGNKEWMPTYTMLENGWAPSFVLIALGPSMLLLVYVIEQARDWRRRRHVALGEWLLCGGMFLLAHQAVRNAFLCIVPLAFMLRRSRSKLTEGPRSAPLLAALALCLLAVAFEDHVVAGYGSLDEARELIAYDVSPATFPEELAVFMKEARIEGGILNDGRWGGFLIWELWPQNHVFVDTRHDLTPDMWPVFMASHAPGTRAQAMAQAFATWGIELAAFRGPTFPAVHADPAWQLLYKAGDQELYQHRLGRHARINAARAREWLSRQHTDARAPLDQLAQKVGAERWLSAPYQRARAAKAERLASSGVAEDVARSLELRATLQFDAGDYRAAASLLHELLRREPQNAKAAYQALLAALGSDDRALAKRLLRFLAQHQEQLSPAQIGRLRAIERDFL